MVVKTIFGRLNDTYKQVQPERVLTVDQLAIERKDHLDLGYISLNTLEVNIYFIDEEQKPIWAMTRKHPEFFFQNIDETVRQLRETGNYKINFHKARDAIQDSETVLFDLTKISFSRYKNNWGYLAIPTDNEYSSLNEEDVKAAIRCGFTLDNLKFLREKGITETGIYIAAPNYVKKEAPFARASFLYDLKRNACFIAKVFTFDLTDGLCIRQYEHL
ncbi:hypothetical protein J4423_04890 [Candidatus Pacearchaeota archaeon]|nr:hypothetical protein [Candidatus Pacearchaeota archaeon]